MAKPGPKSSAELSAYPAYRPSVERLRSPPELSEPARRVFVDIVSSTRSNHFEPSDLPLLCRYCEATVLAQRAEAAIAASGPVIEVASSPWLPIWVQATKVLQGLSLRLRLSPQAREPNTPRRPRPISFYDREPLEPLERATDGASWEDK